MISVALGTEKFSFSRVLTWVDNAIDTKLIPDDEPVIVQAGSTLYSPKNHSIKMHTLIDHVAFMKIIQEARISIIHAGIGYFLDHVELGKMPIIVPRQKRYGEHIDNHQLEFCDVAAPELGFPVAYIEHDFIRAVQNYNPEKKFPSFRGSLVDFLTLITENEK